MTVQTPTPFPLSAQMSEEICFDRRELGLIKAREAADASSAARARFLANMSHELRTPLNAIMGFSDIMRSRMFGPLTGKYSDYAGLIHEAGGH